MSEDELSKAQTYRQRAVEAMELSQTAKDQTAKRTLFEIANSWLGMARHAEEFENHSK